MARLLRHAFDATRFYFVVGMFCGGSLAWSLIAGVLERFMRRGIGARLGQFVIMLGFRGGLWLMRVTRLAQFDLGELDTLREAGPLVIVSNHLSLLDALMIISRLPSVACIAKASLWDNVLLGGSVRLAGYIRNDAPLPLIRAAVRALQAGSQLLIFPEGTRGDGHRLGTFKPGFVLIARGAKVPIQTVFLEYETPYLRQGWKLTRMPSFPLIYRARCGKRFEEIGSSADSAIMLQRYFATELAMT